MPLRKRDFQAVVLAGGMGSRFGDITAQKAKCLLPIGNLPMLWFPLKLLHRLGFQAVIVVIQEHMKSEVSSIPRRYGGLQGLQLELVCIPNNSDLGTADSLRLVSSHIMSRRVLIVSSDLVANMQFHTLTDLSLLHNASLTAFLVSSSQQHRGSQAPGPKSKPKREIDLVGLDLSTKALCLFSSEADVENSFSVRKSLLRDHPHIKVFSNLTDSHLYVVKKWVFDYIAMDKNISSLKGELIPLLVKNQFSKREDEITPASLLDDEGHNDMEIHETEASDMPSLARASMDDMSLLAESLSTWNDHTGDRHGAYHGRMLSCYAHVIPEGIPDSICLRANNLFTYWELNKQILKLMPILAPDFKMCQVHPHSKIQPKAQVDDACIIGDGCQIADKTTIKSSNLGAHCVIEEKVLVSGCVLMDNVVVKSCCQLNGSLICDGVTIPENCQIKDCVVGKGFKLEKGANHSNEMLFESNDRMMEI